MNLEIYASPNRDGETTNITTMYPQGETIHLASVSKDVQTIAQAKLSFEEAAKRIKITSDLMGVQIKTGLRSRRFNPNDKPRIQKCIRKTLSRLTR